MNENANQANKKKGLGALDVMILILLLVVIGSVGLRYMSIRNTDDTATAQAGSYVVTFQVKNIRNSSAEFYLNEGDLFFLDENTQLFGAFHEILSNNDAQKFYEMPDGSMMSVSSHLGGNQYRVDVEASLIASGMMTEDGSFLLNRNKYIGLNQELKIHSKYVSFTVVVTDIAEAQS